jgi:hypothetical protein
VLSVAFFPNKSLTPGRCRKSRASAELHRVGAGSRTHQGARYVRRCARNAHVTAALYREGSRILDHARHCAGTDCRTEPQQPVSNEPALHTAYFKLMAWNCSFHALARQSRCGEFQGFRGVDFGTAHQRLIGWDPAFAKRLRRGSLRLLRYDRIEAGLPSRSSRSKQRLVGATGIEPVTPTMSR